MVVGSRPCLPSRIGAAAAAAATAAKVDIEGNVISEKTMLASEEGGGSRQAEPREPRKSSSSSDSDLGIGERAVSAAGAAVLSAIIVNPLDVAKTRLQAQAAGVPYQGLCGPACFESNSMLSYVKGSVSQSSDPACTSECNRYKGTLDVFSKVIRQEGFGRLWRGTNASLALAAPTVGIYLPCYDVFRNLMEDFADKNCSALTPYVPLVAGSVARSLACVTCYPVELARTRMQAFAETQNGVKPPGVWRTLIEVSNPVRSTNSLQKLVDTVLVTVQNYRILWTGVGAQLARDVPFSAICWSTLEPIRRSILSVVDDKANATTILGANFSAGFVAGTLAAAATCPLDVARTRRQIEKDPRRALNMTTSKTLVEIWRDGGMKGLFTGVGPRVARAGPSVGIVVSFYEVVKYALQRRHQLTD